MKRTWLNAIKSGNFDKWTGLTYYNASKYFLQATETIKGHMTQIKQGLISNKVKPPRVEACAHALQQKMLQQTKYAYTKQKPENYTLMIVGASQSNK